MASILRRVAAGDPAAAQECIHEYGDLVWSIALRLLGDPDEAEETVQETFARIWADADRFDPQLGSERTWVAMLARRRSIERLGRGDRRPETRLPRVDTTARGGGPHRGPERDGEPGLAARALEELPELRQHVLEIAVRRALPPRVIARLLDISPETASSHVTAGLARVREAVLAPGTGRRRG